MPHPAVKSPQALREGRLDIPGMRRTPPRAPSSGQHRAGPRLSRSSDTEKLGMEDREILPPPAPELLRMEAQDEPGGDTEDIHSGAVPQHGADPSAASAAAAADGFGSEPKGKNAKPRARTS